MEEALITASGSSDLTIMGLFLAADPVVKLVMLLLVAASVWCWAIIFDKIMRLRREKKRAALFEDQFWSGGSLDDLYDQTGAEPDNAQARVLLSDAGNGGVPRRAGLPADWMVSCGPPCCRALNALWG